MIHTKHFDIFKSYNENSKIWIFTSDQKLNQTHKCLIEKYLFDFTKRWEAHGIKLKADFTILYDYFIVVCVDASQENASGCSIDKLVHLIKKIESELKISLLDRFNVPTLDENKEIKHLKFSEFNQIKNSDHKVDYFDTSISMLKELNNNFLINSKK